MISKRRTSSIRAPIWCVPALLIVLVRGAFEIGWAGESPVPRPEGLTAAPAGQPAQNPSTAGKVQPDKTQGPATDDLQEILQVLNQRKEYLVKKEEALRETEARIAALKADAEKILERYEKVTKVALEKQEQQTKKKAQAQVDARKASVVQAVKMFESMPPEEAAARFEKMPDKAAMELLRELKPKTAGAVLAQMKPDRAAKLAEKFLGPVARESAPSE
jgi:flagellar motility protein MotE (MotC chaperone)